MSKPIVDGIEHNVQNQSKVVRLSKLSKLGREVVSRYSVSPGPAILVFDGDGNLVYQRSGIPKRKAIVEKVKEFAS